MVQWRKVFLGVIPLLAIPTLGFANPKPPLVNVQKAQNRIVHAKRHLDGIIATVGGGGMGRQPGGQSCNQIYEKGTCEAFGCRWFGHGEIGRCAGGGVLNGHQNDETATGPIFMEENDVAAQLAATGLSRGMEKLSNDLLAMAQYYYTPNFFFYWQKACQRTGGLLAANQGAKVAAALPQVGYFKPQYFVMYDQELIATRQLIWCN